MPPRHPRAALASLQLGRSVYDLIAEMRADDKPYRQIAVMIRDLTDGETDVTDVTVRAWHLAAQTQDVA